MIHNFSAKQIGPIIYGLSVGYRLTFSGTGTVEITGDIEGAENDLAEWRIVDTSSGKFWITAQSAAVRVTADTACTLEVVSGDLPSQLTDPFSK